MHTRGVRPLYIQYIYGTQYDINKEKFICYVFLEIEHCNNINKHFHEFFMYLFFMFVASRQNHAKMDTFKHLTFSCKKTIIYLLLKVGDVIFQKSFRKLSRGGAEYQNKLVVNQQ